MEEMNSIDQAIDNLESQIEDHKKEGRRVQMYAFIFGAFILAAGYSVYLFQEYRVQVSQNYLEKIVNEIVSNSSTASDAINNVVEEAAALQPQSSNSTLIFVFVGVFLAVFGVLMAIYRFHLTEISRAQQQKLGLQRIRIAANNSDKEGFGTEVREALTANAFVFSSGKEKKVESPLPGHPASDFATLFMNKLLDNISIDVKKKE